MFNASVFISDKKTRLNFTSNFYTKITPNLNISARMSWSISEKIEAVEKYRSWVYYQV